MGRRLIALGVKESSYSTISMRYSLGDLGWLPRHVIEVAEFDPDAHNKEQEEAYGPDDVR